MTSHCTAQQERVQWAEGSCLDMRITLMLVGVSKTFFRLRTVWTLRPALAELDQRIKVWKVDRLIYRSGRF